MIKVIALNGNAVSCANAQASIYPWYFVIEGTKNGGWVKEALKTKPMLGDRMKIIWMKNVGHVDWRAQ